tara:strand:+ start:51 stop:434 length:384 start_codon:yes stop_codon:yes gene_type:complete
MGNRRREYDLKRAREVRLSGKTVCASKKVSKEKILMSIFLEDIKQRLHKENASNIIKAAVTGKFPQYPQGDLSKKYSKATVALMKEKGLIKEHPQCNQIDQIKKKVDGEKYKMPSILQEYLHRNSEN